MHRLVLTLVLLAATVLAVPAAASAAQPFTEPRSARFVDDRGDAARQLDVTQMVGYPHYRGRLVVQLYGPRLQVGRRLNGAFVTIDSRGNRRPDFRVSFYLPRDGDGARGLGIARVRRWQVEGRKFRCRGLTAKFRDESSLVEVQVPRRCIGKPRRVRINGELWNFTRYDDRGRPVYGDFDAVPARYRFPRRRL